LDKLSSKKFRCESSGTVSIGKKARGLFARAQHQKKVEPNEIDDASYKP
jgi:hypothetical protein